ncbi:PREDICTED: bifunctional polynucleotide phosphatase/kinase-like [Priapulus caudatus]|uniref:Bifunctional polynucleotide phosphatase/kinase-like n=1 Tax=Priapulus caudatus TaxID=37621 RepID=A0ABM1E0M6_PRICU|nr:PREDICTED: bifunctional polynucleotide phosphatase/kinase-like [Priapulus caudatus]
MESCILRSCSPADRLSDICIGDRVTVMVGRNRQTQLTDTRCSRGQLEVTAYYDDRCILVRHVGRNPCRVGSQLLHGGDILYLCNGEKLCLLYESYCYAVTFPGRSVVKQLPGMSDETERDAVIKVQGHDSKNGSNVRGQPTEHHVRRAALGKSSPDSSFEGKYKRQVEKAAQSVAAKNDARGIADFFKVVPSSAKRRADTPDEIQRSKRSRANSSDEEEAAEEKLQQMRRSLKPHDSTREPTTADAPQCQPSGWTERDGKLHVYTSPGVTASPKIAAFDIDGTIVTTRSGRVFPVDTDDWRLLLAEIPGRLKQLRRDAYKLVFITNQKGIQTGKVRLADFKRKVERIVAKLQVCVQVLVSTGSGVYRKPMLGMWRHLCERGNDGVPVDAAASFYVGDAAGREANWAPKRKKDFSCGDRLFALNAGIRFYTPEEFFLGQKACTLYRMPTFDPRMLKASAPLVDPPTAVVAASTREVVVCVGLPASGKSFFVKKWLIPRGYVRVNRDLLGSWQKCVVRCQRELADGRSVVVDNTNPDAESRARYVECARQARVACRCFLFDVSIEHARHNNDFRLLSGTDGAHVPVNDMVLNSHRARYQQPTLAEGFTEIVKVNFVPDFTCEADERLYRQYILSK